MLGVSLSRGRSRARRSPFARTFACSAIPYRADVRVLDRKLLRGCPRTPHAPPQSAGLVHAFDRPLLTLAVADDAGLGAELVGDPDLSIS